MLTFASNWSFDPGKGGSVTFGGDPQAAAIREGELIAHAT
jgi:hypothetical protein